MTFIYWEDENGDHHGIPLSAIKELLFEPGNAAEEEEPCLEIHVEGEYFEVGGKAARQAWDEIKIQIEKSKVAQNG